MCIFTWSCSISKTVWNSWIKNTSSHMVWCTHSKSVSFRTIQISYVYLNQPYCTCRVGQMPSGLCRCQAPRTSVIHLFHLCVFRNFDISQFCSACLAYGVDMYINVQRPHLSNIESSNNFWLWKNKGISQES